MQEPAGFRWTFDGVTDGLGVTIASRLQSGSPPRLRTAATPPFEDTATRTSFGTHQWGVYVDAVCYVG